MTRPQKNGGGLEGRAVRLEGDRAGGMSKHFFEHRAALFGTPLEMAAAALHFLETRASAGDAFGIEKAGYGAVQSDVALQQVMARQRAAVANGHDSLRVSAHEAQDYAVTPAFSSPPGPGPRAWFPHALDRNVAALLSAVRVSPEFLAATGLVLAGGALLEAGLRPAPLGLADVHAMCAATGFDLDFFVTDGAPFRGSVCVYRDALVRHLRGSGGVLDVASVRRGFACELSVAYAGGHVVKMQVVDLGVAASPMALVQSFDIAAAKQYYCATTRRVVMTEDAALSLASGVLPYDRRFIGDPRYAARLAKYLRRTGFALALPDAAAKAALHVVLHVRARLHQELARSPADARALAVQHMGSWISEMSVCDTATFAASHVLLELGGATNQRGYGSTPRIGGCAPISGGIGRQGLALMGARPDAVTELFGVFQLFRVLHAARALLSGSC